MAVGAVKPKNRAAVDLGSKGGKKGGPARAATPDSSDRALLSLLKRIKAGKDTTEVREFSIQLERVIFHKQVQ